MSKLLNKLTDEELHDIYDWVAAAIRKKEYKRVPNDIELLSHIDADIKRLQYLRKLKAKVYSMIG